MLDEAREKKKLLHDAYCSANSSSFLHSVWINQDPSWVWRIDVKPGTDETHVNRSL